MSLLTPLFLLGALAVALPVIFHLIRRTSKNRQAFSSLMFLLPTPPRVTRKSRLENIFLLILRCFVLCLLALGFARPFFPDSKNSPLKSGGAKRIVVLVDASASMRRGDLWNQALDRAEAVLRKADVGDQAAVFAFDRSTHRLLNFDEWTKLDPGERAAQARSRLSAQGTSWADTHLGAALVTALESFDEGEGKDQSTGQRLVVLISDLQEGSRMEALQAYEWPARVELQLETLKPVRTSNAGLQLVMDHHELTTDADEGVRVRISNAADSKREQFKVQWEGVTALKPVEAYVPPGQSRVVHLPLLPAGMTSEHIVLSGDDEQFDNRVHYVAPKAEVINVLYLGSEDATNSAQPLYFLKRAFQQTRRQDVEVLARTPGAVTAVDVSQAKFVIVADAPPDAAPIKSFVENGGTALFVLKNTSGAAGLGQVLGAPGLAAEEAVVRQYAMLTDIDFQHPLFAPYADPRFSDFTKIHFWKHRRLEVAQLPKARVLAHFDDDVPALIEAPVGRGRVLALTSGWQPGDSQLALSTKFVPLLYSMLDLGLGAPPTQTQYIVGDTVLLPTNNTARLTVRGPGGQALSSPVDGSFSGANEPGVYTVDGAAAPLRFAVNLAADESRTTPMSLDELQRYGVALKATEKQLARQAEQQRRLANTELESRQKLWRWLVVAALVVLILETWLSGRLTRRVPEQAPA